MRLLPLAAAALAATAPALAQAPSSEGAPSARSSTRAGSTASLRVARDPDEIICRRQREIGSRLVIRRDCMTRAQWAEYRRQLRANIDHAQNTRVHRMN